MNLPCPMTVLLVVVLFLQPLLPVTLINPVEHLQRSEAAAPVVAFGADNVDRLMPVTYQIDLPIHYQSGEEAAPLPILHREFQPMTQPSPASYSPIRYKSQTDSIFRNLQLGSADTVASLAAGNVFASTASTNTLATLITNGFLEQTVPYTGYVFFTTTLSFDYRGGRVYLSANSDGGGLIGIDDRIIMTVTHANNSHSYFSGGGKTQTDCSTYAGGVPDVTPYFAYGTNQVEITLKDECGWKYSSTPLWLVPSYSDEQGLAQDECPLCNNQQSQHFLGGPINVRSGNYNYQVTDLSIATSGQPLRFERSYNLDFIHLKETREQGKLGQISAKRNADADPAQRLS